MNDTYFISCAREDAALALRLARDLRSAGVRVWIDQIAIRAGDTWDRAVDRLSMRATACS
jgi:hypothetical protein